MKMSIEDLKVKVKILEGPKILGIATVYNPPWTYHNYLILKSKYSNERGEYLWVKPPAYKDNIGKWHDIIYLEDKELWKQLERKINDEYLKEKEKNGQPGEGRFTDEDYEKFDKAIQ
jgi:hypothetical protein